VNVRAFARAHGRSLSTVTASGLAAFGFVRAASSAAAGSGEQGFLFTLAGVAVAAAGKSIVDVAMRGETYRQGAYTERARAVQRVLQAARTARAAGGGAWLANQQVVISGGGNFDIDRRYDEAIEAHGIAIATVSGTAFEEDVWLGMEGVDAARRFADTVQRLQFDAFETRTTYLAVVTAEMEKLRASLLAGLGFWF
jgi:hypothetical protein